MTMELGFGDSDTMGDARKIKMKVIGVGGAGTNMVDRLMLSHPLEIPMGVINTDQQALSSSPVQEKLCFGQATTYGLGTGGAPEVGREAALEDKEALRRMVEDTDLLFITAGLGGGTGTGAAPVLAELATQAGALVIAFVAMPFTIERAQRAGVAKEGLRQLRDTCNAVIPLPNDLLIQESDTDAPLLDAFAKADTWIARAITSIWAMMHRTGLMNLDFSQLRQAFAKKAGKTLFGLGSGESSGKALDDLKVCPLLHTPEFSKRADHLLVNIQGGPSLGLADVQMIMDEVTDAFGKDANVIMGSVIDEDLGRNVEICVLGTSDVGAASVSRWSTKKVSKPAATKSAKAKETLIEEPPAKAKKPKRVARQTHRSSRKGDQSEFSFSDSVPKGEFENASATVFEGQDLDTPTYLRRGVKIAI